MKKYILIFAMLFLLTPLKGRTASEEFEIKHADSLEADGAQINVQGNILIKYKDAVIEAPEGRINTNQEGKPDNALFYSRAKIKLKDRKIEADKITVSIQDETIYAEGNTSSELKDKNNNLITITSDHQELHWNGENANAKGNIKTTYQDTKVISDEAKIIYKNKKPQQVIFTGSTKPAYMEQENHKTLAKELIFDINTNDIYAKGEVTSVIWPYKTKPKNKQNPISLNTDELFIDHKTGEVSAKGNLSRVKITYEDTKGESNEALLLRDEENKKPEKIIFKGNANVSQADKELSSEEVVFNFNDKKLTSNTITNKRPKTLIFKK
ncbi:MAG: hypothetical protein A3I68_08470 [Candidatus Melainabacteria bacterium RIFCSPLOWO2_02_FULL_35_15]|nr:MAG: hypothetical protein A3F80_08695 [Candidatus Melainabacteria bacterium RIFCSPLOWO2_12_FULL_35_11]OGI14005.1 MAG: hypothetical protein A3I68_08470 [Candidatus Melainabacteria bacterium RIFCSPLOWO2_02_FULL_35_15]